MTVENRGLFRGASYALPPSIICWAVIIRIALEVMPWA